MTVKKKTFPRLYLHGIKLHRVVCNGFSVVKHPVSSDFLVTRYVFIFEVVNLKTSLWFNIMPLRQLLVLCLETRFR